MERNVNKLQCFDSAASQRQMHTEVILFLFFIFILSFRFDSYFQVVESTVCRARVRLCSGAVSVTGLIY